MPQLIHTWNSATTGTIQVQFQTSYHGNLESAGDKYTAADMAVNGAVSFYRVTSTAAPLNLAQGLNIRREQLSKEQANIALGQIAVEASYLQGLLTSAQGQLGEVHLQQIAKNGEIDRKLNTLEASIMDTINGLMPGVNSGRVFAKIHEKLDNGSMSWAPIVNLPSLARPEGVRRPTPFVGRH